MKENLEQIRKYWDEQQPLFQKIYRDGFAKFAQSLPNLKEAFELKDRALRCMDEGTPGGIHLAGSGILLSEDEAAHVLGNARVEGIYSHTECSAAALFARNNNLDESQAETLGEEAARKIAAKIAVPYLGHINADQLKRPLSFHIARIAYYDGSGRFDYSRVSNFPPGFTISRKYLNPDYAKKEAEIAISIALGVQGFGPLITKESPFVLIAIAENEHELATLKQELEDVAKGFAEKVKVEAFLAPAS